MAHSRENPGGHGDVPLAELVGGLAMACDLANGFPPEKVLRTAIVAVEIARRAGLDDATARDAYWVTILRFLGCTGFAHEEAHVYGAGDDLQVRNVMALADAAQPISTVRAIASRVGRGAPVTERVRAVGKLLFDGEAVVRHARTQCDVSLMLSRVVGISQPLCNALAQVCERYDGKGQPEGARGDAIAIATRILHVADVAEIAHHRHGCAEAAAEVERRIAHHLDPELARVFVRDAPEICEAIEGGSVWDRFLAAEPRPATIADAARAGDVALAFAHFADLKSVFTLGHSVRVARLATTAAESLALAPESITELRHAALLHDLGRVSVPTGVWDRAGPLSAADWERVRLHAYYTERITRLAPAWKGVARLAAAAHERLDTSGYPHGAGPGAMPSRVLAAADIVAALGEPRAHRPSRTLDEAARIVREEIAAGRLDRTAADAVLAAAGAAPAPRTAWPRGLSDREVEVLRLLARGKTNKEIASLLGISARTVQNHVAHIYDKAGVYSRAGAALFAVEHALLE